MLGRGTFTLTHGASIGEENMNRRPTPEELASFVECTDRKADGTECDACALARKILPVVFAVLVPPGPTLGNAREMAYTLIAASISVLVWSMTPKFENGQTVDDNEDLMFDVFFMILGSALKARGFDVAERRDDDDVVDVDPFKRQH